MADDLPKRLSFEDAAFVHFERDSMPLNVGSVAIYDGIISYQSFLAHVDRRVDRIPRNRQRLAFAPFNIAHPAWVDDPRFDITRHIRPATLPAPGGRAELLAFAARFFSEPLARDKPLWEILLVQGLDGHRTAHVAKVHHCLVDGVAGVDLLSAVLDVQPTPPERARRPAHPPPAAQSPRDGQLFDAVADSWMAQARAGADFTFALLNPRGTARQLAKILRAFGASGRYLASPAPLTPWNRPLSGPTQLAWQPLEFAAVRDTAHLLGGKVNDVVLTVLAGALARYMDSLGEQTEGVTLRVACPVNVRSDAEGEDLGNRVSFMLVGLPLGATDPIARFRMIRAETSALKDIDQSNTFDSAMRTVGRMPAPYQAFLGQTLTMPNTVANLVCTNIAGPQSPLYMTTHRVLEHYPWVPIVWRMGLSVALMSFDTSLSFTFVGDRNVPGDFGRLGAYLQESFDELARAARSTQHAPAAATPAG
jgi:WS/DGAT/MGAT family acyltransferase